MHMSVSPPVRVVRNDDSGRILPLLRAGVYLDRRRGASLRRESGMAGWEGVGSEPEGPGAWVAALPPGAIRVKSR